jgi:hypothetical protein
VNSRGSHGTRVVARRTIILTLAVAFGNKIVGVKNRRVEKGVEKSILPRRG